MGCYDFVGLDSWFSTLAAPWNPPGSFEKLPIPGPHPRPIQPESLGVMPEDRDILKLPNHSKEQAGLMY